MHLNFSAKALLKGIRRSQSPPEKQQSDRATQTSNSQTSNSQTSNSQTSNSQTSNSQTSNPQTSNPQAAKFDFWLYFIISAIVLSGAGLLNWLIDPLWYSHENQLTNKNFAFNERISKTNLFLRTKDSGYDCLILGSSRAIALRASVFRHQRCFNYAIKGGNIRDFIDYAKFLKEQGLIPKTVYVGVDEFNLVAGQEVEKSGADAEHIATPSVYHAFFSADVFLFSLMTLAGISPDKAQYYDRNFEVADFEHPPQYTPQFTKKLSPQQCDLSKVDLFNQLKDVFPNAKYVGYVPPRSAWSVVNETYSRNLTDCTLQGFYQVSQTYDAFYDFSIPSAITQDPRNTFDGSHFFTPTNDRIAAIFQHQDLQHQASDFGIQVNAHKFEDYKKRYKDEIREFLTRENALDRWQN